MSQWKNTLRMEHGELVAEVALPLLQAQEPVLLHLAGATALTPAMEQAVDTLLARLPDMEPRIAEATFSAYQEWLGRYGNEDGFPVAADSKALTAFYQLRVIYLPYEPETGRFGLGFECEWEVEHGFGLQFRHWEIVEVGDEAEAFSFHD